MLRSGDLLRSHTSRNSVGWLVAVKKLKSKTLLLPFFVFGGEHTPLSVTTKAMMNGPYASWSELARLIFEGGCRVSFGIAVWSKWRLSFAFRGTTREI